MRIWVHQAVLQNYQGIPRLFSGILHLFPEVALVFLKRRGFEEKHSRRRLLLELHEPFIQITSVPIDTRASDKLLLSSRRLQLETSI